MIYLLCHGFGFSNEYWGNLIPLLDGEIAFFDDDFDKTKRYIGIGHSIGFQKLNNSGIKFDFLIGLQGFINFCGNDPGEGKIRGENIDRMIKMFEADVSQALKLFHNVCRYPDPVHEKAVCKQSLMDDLLSMKKSYEHCGCPTLIIGSGEDEIVTMSLIHDNFQHMGNVIVEEIDGVPHSLGFHKPAEVSEKIKKFCK
jgi:pimeloyl-[acyl-carrier protein] methyl ester esterase